MGKQSRRRAERRVHERLEPGRSRSSEPESIHDSDTKRWLVAVGLLAVLVYLTGLFGEFVFDDKLIQRDARILGKTSFWQIFVTDYWGGYIGTTADLYRPLTVASYAANHALAGLSSPAFHAVNIALHGLVSVLVVLLVQAVLRDRQVGVVAGLLFATHPIHAEAVTNIVGRAELLAAFFLLLALYLHARCYRLWGASAALWLPAAGLCYAGALLSKESAIVGPGLLLLVDASRRMRERQRTARVDESEQEAPRTLAALGLYLAVAVGYLLIRYAVLDRWTQEPPAKSDYLLFGHPLETRFFTSLVVFGTYVRLLLFPATLSADYSFSQLPLTDALDSFPGLAGLATALLLIVALAWALRKRVVWAVFSIGFFAIAYALASNLIVPIGVLVAERLMYLPSVGFCAGLAGAGSVVFRRLRERTAAAWSRELPALALGLVLVLYGGRTLARNLDWADHETLYRATVEASPRCHSARFNYAAILLGNGRDEQALRQLLVAQQIRDDHYPSLVNLTIVQLRLGRVEEARRHALRGLEVRPDSRKLRRLLQQIERRRGSPGPS